MNATCKLKLRCFDVPVGEMMPVYAQEHQRLLSGCQMIKMCNRINRRAVVDSCRSIVINTHLLLTVFHFVWAEGLAAEGDIWSIFVVMRACRLC